MKGRIGVKDWGFLLPVLKQMQLLNILITLWCDLNSRALKGGVIYESGPAAPPCVASLRFPSAGKGGSPK